MTGDIRLNDQAQLKGDPGDPDPDVTELLDAIRAGGDIDVIRKGVELVLQAPYRGRARSYCSMLSPVDDEAAHRAQHLEDGRMKSRSSKSSLSEAHRGLRSTSVVSTHRANRPLRVALTPEPSCALDRGKLIEPAPEGLLEAGAVARLVNSPANDGPELLAALDAEGWKCQS